MNRKRNGHLKYGLAFAALLALLLLFLGWSLCAGSVEIPLEEVAEVFAWKLGCAPAPGASSAAGIVWEIRFPRALAAILLGGALGLSGYLLQTFFRNPIAGPFVLGISSGAKLLVACLMVFSLGHAVRVTSAAMILAAFAGALASMGLVLLMAGRVEQTAGLILGGTMIGYICSAATDILVTFADDTDIVNLHNWSQGSFSGRIRQSCAWWCFPPRQPYSFSLSRWLRTRWERSMQKAWGSMWAVSGPGWCSYPVFYQPVSWPLPVRCPLWGSPCPIW